MLYVLYKIEFCNTTATADVEAIRNLSSIASQLTTSNKLTMPGALTVTNDLSVGGDAYIGKDKNFILDGDNKWIFHTPDDGRKILYLAPWNGKDNWDWSKQFTIDNNGNVSSAGELSVKTLDGGKQVKIGSSQIKFRGDGIVHYGLTNDKDGKFKISNLSGTGYIGSGWVNDCLTLDPTGNSTFNGSLVVNGTIKRTTHLFYQRLSVTKNSSYTIQHDLNIPIYLLTIRLFALWDNIWYDITGQMINSNYSHSYGIRVGDNNNFVLYTGNGCVAVVRNNNLTGLCPDNATYDLYII
jgi:hypothetical protein